MGGLSKLRQWLKDNGCAAAFHDGLPELQRGAVYISDDLTRLHRFRGRASSYMTGTEFFEQWIRGVMFQLRSGVVKVYVAVYDNPELVPVEKKAEQARRREGKKPYASGCELSDAGLRQSKSGAFEPFEVNRLISSFGMRRKLYIYILNKLRSVLLPPGTFLVFDYNICGPFLCPGGGRKERVLPNAVREHGEADKQCIWWLTQFKDAHAIVSSIDSDLMVLLAWYQHVRPRPNTYLQYEAKTYIDTAKLLECIRKKLKPTSMEHFVRACCACGNDYVEKSKIFSYMNEGDIMMHVSSTDDAMSLVEATYSLKLKEARRMSLSQCAHLCRDRKTRFGPPPDDDSDVWNMLEWNVLYWTEKWDAVGTSLEEVFQ